jgi:hypothetical protein
MPLIPKSFFFASAMAIGLAQAQTPTPAQAQAIAREAVLWGYPMVEQHATAQALFAKGGEWNRLYLRERLATAGDKILRNPNPDFASSTVFLDLRNEPLVLTVGKSDAKNPISLQFWDWLGQQSTNLGTRFAPTGGVYVIAGPEWNGDKPAGASQVIRLETSLAVAQLRVMSANPADKAALQKANANLRFQKLSVFASRKTPKTYGPLELSPVDYEKVKKAEVLLGLIASHMPWAPLQNSEKELKAKYAQIGLEGKSFNWSKLSPDLQKAIQYGVDEALADIHTNAKFKGNTALGGSRESFKNDPLLRARSAFWTTLAHERTESLEFPINVDREGKTLAASFKRYTLKFSPEEMPPAESWSLSLYGEDRFLSENDRGIYKLDAKALEKMVKDRDGGITLFIQQSPPEDADMQSNWIPAPEGAFSLNLRLYRPKTEALAGTWSAPTLRSFPR